MEKLELISQLEEQANSLSFDDDDGLDALTRRAEMYIRGIFGDGSKYLTDLDHIAFHPSVFPTSRDYELQTWNQGKNSIINLFKTMKEELIVFSVDSAPSKLKSMEIDLTKQVFVVHGHDDEMKHAVARTLTALGLDPVILHEKANQGRTIIEKFTDYAQVSFAVVLLSPDDVAHARATDSSAQTYRARQNVILELGYFLGKLGREHVVAIHRQEKGFEMPSDFSGILFVPYDGAGRWQFDLGRELKACGYDIDLNLLV